MESDLQRLNNIIDCMWKKTKFELFFDQVVELEDHLIVSRKKLLLDTFGEYIRDKGKNSSIEQKIIVYNRCAILCGLKEYVIKQTTNEVKL